MINLEGVRPLSSSAVRQARVSAHAAFDLLWMKKHMSRKDAYAWLATCFDQNEVHMAHMTVEQCERVRRLSIEKLRSV
jgi:hypothetical protein